MDQEQRSQRRAAAKAFFESLDQFEETLQLPNSPATKSQLQSGTNSPSQPQNSRSSSFTLADLEEAAADIEQFFQSRHTQSQASKE